MTSSLVLKGKLAFITFNLDVINKLETRKLLGIKEEWLKSKAIIDMPLATYNNISMNIRYEYTNGDHLPYILPALWSIKILNKDYVISPHNFYTSLDDYQVYADMSIRRREDEDRYLAMVTLL